LDCPCLGCPSAERPFHRPSEGLPSDLEGDPLGLEEGQSHRLGGAGEEARSRAHDPAGGIRRSHPWEEAAQSRAAAQAEEEARSRLADRILEALPCLAVRIPEVRPFHLAVCPEEQSLEAQNQAAVRSPQEDREGEAAASAVRPWGGPSPVRPWLAAGTRTRRRTCR
jgi:hypothetical protein